MFPQPDNVMHLEDAHKEAVIGAHFAACNWIRELVNAFVMEPKRPTKAKVRGARWKDKPGSDGRTAAYF